MNGPQAARRLRSVGLVISAAAAMFTAGCANMRDVKLLAVGGVNPDSTVSAEVVAVQHAPGPYPRFSQVPPPSSDVRTGPEWRAAVLSEWNTKRKTDREAAALPFSLANTDTEVWAERTRAKIPAGERSQPAPSVADQAEAFAASQRARATPPPPPQ